MQTATESHTPHKPTKRPQSKVSFIRPESGESVTRVLDLGDNGNRKSFVNLCYWAARNKIDLSIKNSD